MVQFGQVFVIWMVLYFVTCSEISQTQLEYEEGLPIAPTNATIEPPTEPPTEFPIKTTTSYCDDDRNIGPIEPIHGQLVYLEHFFNHGKWYYSKKGSKKVGKSYHARKDLTQIKDQWPAWRWIVCGDKKFVCLEPVRYSGWYLYFKESGIGKVAKSSNPKSKSWAKLLIVRSVPSGLGYGQEVMLYNMYYRAFAFVRVYIPPRCVDWVKVFDNRNYGTQPFDYSYRMSTGMTRTTSTTLEVSVSLGNTISVAMGAIAKVGYTWSTTYTQTQSKYETQSYKIEVSGKQHIRVMQQVGSYGIHYQWKTNEYMVCCETLTGGICGNNTNNNFQYYNNHHCYRNHHRQDK